MPEWNIVETKQDAVIGEYVYRAIINERGVRVFRCPIDKQWWHHGVMCQAFDEKEQRFRASCQAHVQYFKTMQDVERMIKTL